MTERNLMAIILAHQVSFTAPSSTLKHLSYEVNIWPSFCCLPSSCFFSKNLFYWIAPLPLLSMSIEVSG